MRNRNKPLPPAPGPNMAWCQKCVKWKPEDEFSFDRTGFRIGGKTGLRRRLCRKCKAADMQDYFARRRLGLTAPEINTTRGAKAEAYNKFMAENKRRMDLGADPLMVMPGIEKKRIANTVEEARELTTKWARMNGPWGVIQAKIDVIRKRMATMAHLTVRNQMTRYMYQIEDLIKEQEECEQAEQNKKLT